MSGIPGKYEEIEACSPVTGGSDRVDGGALAPGRCGPVVALEDDPGAGFQQP